MTIATVIENQIISIEAEMNALYQNDTTNDKLQTELLIIMEQYSNALEALENKIIITSGYISILDSLYQ